MKKYIFLLAGISVFALGVSAAHAQSSGGGGVGGGGGGSAQFVIGDRVQTTALLNVRSAPSTATGTLLGTQFWGALGTITGGPATVNGYNWWNVNYDAGVDGWSVESYLAKVQSPPSFVVTAPGAGEVLKQGAQYIVKWNYPSELSGKNIELFVVVHNVNTNESWYILQTNLGVSSVVPSGGVAIWNIGSNILPGSYRVSVSARDLSSGIFTITTSNVFSISSSVPLVNCADVNKDGRPNVLDLNLIINVAFKGVTSTYVTDVNGDGMTNGIDVTQEVNYLFKGGPQPTGCVVPNNAPVIVSSPGATTTVQLGVSKLYSWEVSDLDSSRFDVTVNWGDGTMENSDNLTPPNYTGQFGYGNFHTYSQLGNYTISFTVSDQEGGVATKLSIITVSSGATNQPPIVNNFIVPNSVVVGSNASVLIKATDPEGATLTYSVDWGDYSPKSQATGASGVWVTLNHSYSTAGIYNVSSSISDGQSSGWAFAGPAQITVTNPTSTINLPPSFNSFTGPSSVIVGTIGNWQTLVTDPEGGDLTYTLDWGDGTATSTYIGPSGAFITIAHTFYQLGIKTIQVTARDVGGLTAVRSTTVNVASSGGVTSTPPIAPKTYPTPTKILSPSAYPVSASALESIQLQISNITEQLRLLLLQLGQ